LVNEFLSADYYFRTTEFSPTRSLRPEINSGLASMRNGMRSGFLISPSLSTRIISEKPGDSSQSSRIEVSVAVFWGFSTRTKSLRLRGSASGAMMRFGASDSSDVAVLADPTVADLASSDFAEADLVAAGLAVFAVLTLDLASDADLSESLFLAAGFEIVTVGTSVDFGLAVSSPADLRRRNSFFGASAGSARRVPVDS